MLKSYHYLLTGSYYNYDSSTTSGHDDSVMTDQLSGHWFLRASGMEDDTVSNKFILSVSSCKLFIHLIF